MNLSDEDLGLILEGKGHKLHDGQKSREEAIHELAQLLAAEEPILAREGPLKSRGTANFGRENEGRDGIALFVPHDSEDERPGEVTEQ
jgi:hypothetical protein